MDVWAFLFTEKVLVTVFICLVLSEQIGHRELAMDVICITTWREAERCNHRDEDGLLCTRFANEGLLAVPDSFVLFLCQRVSGIGVLDLAEVDGIVISVDKQINLGTLMDGSPTHGILLAFVRPGMYAADHSREAERVLDLRDVLHTHALEGSACPSGMD